ncbi:MAG TPA: hypothetical protein VFU21_07970 [Kofleriaceae bacterium]|nr:hypothetical protein [Kofleriaceae bacterium]
MRRFCLVAAALVAAAACGGKREVGSTAKPVAQAAPARRPPPPPDPDPDPHPDPDPGAQPPAAEPDLDALARPEAEQDRRQQFARAVAAISQQVGQPITGEKALADMPCGGWSGPDCANLTVGIEIARTCAPIVASFHRKKTAEIAGVLARAISIHSVWHDAYGYVWKTTRKGPGYTYAGCLFSECDPGDLRSGQVDGILYQVGRLIGTTQGPACGPACTLEPGAGAPRR